MDSDEFVLLTASILHDIGKVGQRYTKNENHADLGYSFIRNIPYNNKDMDRISKLVKYHHTNADMAELESNDKGLLKILQIADRKSAAHDREDRDEKEFKDIKLHKISNEIGINNNENAGGVYELKTLDYQEDRSINSGYKDLDNKIKEDVSKLDFASNNKYEFFNTLDSVLYKDTAFIPSAFYYSKPDISLYHHLKLTAAIAMSLYRSSKAHSSEILDSNENQSFILLMCNISGIQEYIFKHYKSEAADEKGTRRLKGRSFMIKLFTDSIESYIINKFNLYRFNIAWEKSDGFLLLMDNSEDNIKKLEQARKDIDMGLVNKKRGITANIAWVSASLDDFTTLEADRDSVLTGSDDKFKNKMQDLYDNMDRAKRTKMQEIFSDVNIPNDAKFGTSIKNMCESCGLDNIYEGSEKCIGCIEEEYIGRSLYDHKNIIMKIDNNSNAVNRKGIILFNFGDKYIQYYFSSDENGEVIKIYDYDNKGHHNINTSYKNWRFIFQAKYVPSDGSSIVPLNNYFGWESEHKMLGVLKADVDNMGLIVARGLKRITISKLASLTFEFEYFFSAKLDETAKKHDIYVIYSGGDDITAAGEINKLIEFISDFHEEFDKYFSKKVNISVGVTAISPKFPLRRAITNAEKNLNTAKKATDRETKIVKNSINMFDTTMGWGIYSKMNKIGVDIYEIIENYHLGKGFPYFLYSLGKSYNKSIKKGTIITDDISRGCVTIPDPMLYYYVNRNYRADNKNATHEKNVLMEKLCENNDENWRYMNYLSSYIVIKIRNEEGQK